MNEGPFRRNGKIAVFGVAHQPYWNQFPGLRERLEMFHAKLCEKVSSSGAEIIDFGIIDSNSRAFDAVKEIDAADPDVIFCNMVTYATSSVFAPILQGKTRPIVLTALQPLAALDYQTANTFMQLENDCICSVPEFIGVANRFGKKINDVIIGTLENDGRVDAEIADWCRIASVLHALHGARIGLMGHVLESMYDMHTDPTAVSSAFGLHVPLLEPDSLLEIRKQVTPGETEDKMRLIREEFDFPDPKHDPVTVRLTDEDLREAAISAAALDRFVQMNSLTGLAYYFEGPERSETRLLASSLIVGNSLLIGQGFPMCGEFDLKTCIAMLIMDRLGIGGSFAELHPLDFNDNCILVGHDGPHHIRIAEGKPVLRSLLKYHGKPGHGASVEFKLREGPITMLGITQNAHGEFRFVIGEGTSEKGPIPPTGNTNTRARFSPDTREFVRKWVMAGPTHHFALGVGHHADSLVKTAEALGIEYVVIK